MQPNRNHVDPVDDESTEIDMNYLIENESSFFTSILQEFDAPENGLNDEPFYLRRDHREGIFINTKKKRKRLAVIRYQQRKRIRATKKLLFMYAIFLFYFHFIIVFILLNFFWFFFLTG